VLLHEAEFFAFIVSSTGWKYRRVFSETEKNNYCIDEDGENESTCFYSMLPG